MLFTKIMSKKKIYIYFTLASILLLGSFISYFNSDENDFSERVKVSLRSVGNQLLLSNNDSTSLVLPIREIGSYKYQLSFQNNLSFEPSDLTTIIKNSFDKSSLPSFYRIAILRCSDGEVAYSYEIKNHSEKDIIPCKGRVLPNTCYTVDVKFTNKTEQLLNKYAFLLIFLILGFTVFLDFLFSKNKHTHSSSFSKNAITIGSFGFYPDQHKLIREAVEITLSKKECELLAIFADSPNQIIKRDELSKKVWEDNGVFVGRSLDTYISKLRKKLKEDSSIKITNVHGVGYSLKIEDTKN